MADAEVNILSLNNESREGTGKKVSSVTDDDQML